MRGKNIFIITMLILMNLSSTSFAYNDTKDHWADDTISKMSEYNIIKGYTDDSFKPDNEMTRAEFIVVINRLLGLERESSKYIPDISRQDWYYSDIRKAVAAGIIMGDQEGYIHPNAKITREEAVTILARAFKIEAPMQDELRYIDEYEISSWARNSVGTFVNKGYIKGYTDNTIRAKSTIKRAEALTIIERIVPNILVTNVYDGLITGNALVYTNNVTLNNLKISGNLMIAGNVSNTLIAKNVSVNGDLIICEETEEIANIRYDGKRYEIYPIGKIENQNYINEEYGIKFSVPNNAVVKEFSGDNEIDFTEKDLIVIDIKQNEDYYLKNIKTIAKEETKKYANLFGFIETGKVGIADYALYDDRENAQMIVIKRDSVVYTLIFFNIVSDNFVDNVLSTMELLKTENITDSKYLIYKNSTLSLKFTYRDKYVVVDDSYNTNNINEANGLFKLFIQVNTITDIQNYNMSQIKALLTSLVRNDGEIIKSETMKLMNNDAIKYKVQSEEKIIYSLYVVIGNNLYNFIFTGDEYGMNEVGEELFDEIIKTLEF